MVGQAGIKIKMCGLSRVCDVEAANRILPDYIGFVFAKGSRRYVDRENACQLQRMLDTRIKSVGVFVDEEPEVVASFLADGTIDMAQLHGSEDGEYIRRLRSMTDRPIIQAFCVSAARDIERARQSSADYVLLDSGAGSGSTFDWTILSQMDKPYFLAGGLSPENVPSACRMLHPFAVDVSSGIESDGVKDERKMQEFAAAVREINIRV